MALVVAVKMFPSYQQELMRESTQCYCDLEPLINRPFPIYKVQIVTSSPTGTLATGWVLT